MCANVHSWSESMSFKFCKFCSKESESLTLIVEKRKLLSKLQTLGLKLPHQMKPATMMQTDMTNPNMIQPQPQPQMQHISVSGRCIFWNKICFCEENISIFHKSGGEVLIFMHQINTPPPIPLCACADIFGKINPHILRIGGQEFNLWNKNTIPI